MDARLRIILIAVSIYNLQFSNGLSQMSKTSHTANWGSGISIATLGTGLINYLSNGHIQTSYMVGVSTCSSAQLRATVKGHAISDRSIGMKGTQVEACMATCFCFL